MIRLAGRVMQLAVLAAAMVQLAGLLQSVHPLFDSIAHFRFHITVCLVLGILVLLAMRSWRLAGLAAAVSAAGVLAMAPALGAIGSAPESKGRRIVLVQFNMLFKNPSPAAIATQIRAVNADAVTLEEVSERNKVLLAELKSDYPYQVFCRSFSVGGVAVASRWPITQQGCSEGQGLAWVRADVEGLPVTFASLHLHWPFPFEQAQQISALDRQFKALPEPVILGGDFNAAPWSHSAARVAEATGTQVAAGLRLSYEASAFGLGHWPFLPIDQVLLPERASAVDVRTGAPAGSDHLPVIATIDLSQ